MKKHIMLSNEAHTALRVLAALEGKTLEGKVNELILTAAEGKIKKEEV